MHTHQVENVLIYENDNAVTAADTPFHAGRDHWWQAETALMPATCPVEWVESEHPLFLLYTSGSTGEEGRRGGVKHLSLRPLSSPAAPDFLSPLPLPLLFCCVP